MHLISFRKPIKKLLRSGSAEHSDICLRCGPMASDQVAHLHQPEGVGLALRGQGCPLGPWGSSSEAAPWEKAWAATGSEDTRALFLLLGPHFPGCSAGWPSTGVGTFVWRLFLPEDNALGQETCPGAGHLSPGSSRQGRAEKGLHPWQAQVTCGVGSRCQRACYSGRGPADSSVCDEGNGAAQGQEILASPPGSAARPGEKCGHGRKPRQQCNTRAVVCDQLNCQETLHVRLSSDTFSTGYSCLCVSPKGPAWGRREAQGGDGHPACLCPAPGPQFPLCEEPHRAA